MPLKIVLIDCDDIFSKGSNHIQNHQENASSTEAVQQQTFNLSANINTSDIALLKCSAFSEEVIQLIKSIRESIPGLRVLVLSEDSRPEWLVNVLAAGASGYVLSNSQSAELSQAFKTIAKGGIYVDSRFTQIEKNTLPENNLESNNQYTDSKALTEKEIDVLHLVAEGFTNAEIANKLITSIRTIETRRKNLLLKTATTNTATLIKYAVRNGLI